MASSVAVARKTSERASQNRANAKFVVCCPTNNENRTMCGKMHHRSDANNKTTIVRRIGTFKVSFIQRLPLITYKMLIPRASNAKRMMAVFVLGSGVAYRLLQASVCTFPRELTSAVCGASRGRDERNRCSAEGLGDLHVNGCRRGRWLARRAGLHSV